MSKPKHLFPWMADMERPWVGLGWVIIGASMVSVVLIKVFLPFQPPTKFNSHDVLAGLRPINSPVAFATIALFLTMVLASMMWTSFDLIDRRGRVVWMIPMMVCCFACTPFVGQTLYMVLGRRDTDTDPGIQGSKDSAKEASKGSKGNKADQKKR